MYVLNFVIVIDNDTVVLALQMPPVPLPAYHLCVYARSPPVEILYMTLSLFFGRSSSTYSDTSLSTRPPFSDTVAFSVVVFVSFGTGLSFAAGESLPGGRPGILQIILEDATVYFLVIFSSHLVTLVVALSTRVSSNIPILVRFSNQLAQPSIQLLPSL